MKPLKHVIRENPFKRKIVARLKLQFSAYVIVYEAQTKVGIPDLIIGAQSFFIALEVKKAKSEVYYKDGTMKPKGRHIRQYVEILKIRKAGNYADFIYPENEEEIFKQIQSVLTVPA